MTENPETGCWQAGFPTTCEVTRKVHNLATLIAPIQRLLSKPETFRRRYLDAPPMVEKTPGKSKKARKARQREGSTSHAVGPTSVSFEADRAWGRLCHDLLRTRYWMGKGVRTARELLELMPGAGIDPRSGKYARLVQSGWKTHHKRVRLLDHLRRYHIDEGLLRGIDARLQESDGLWSPLLGVDNLHAVVEQMERITDEFGRYVHSKVLTARDPDRRRQALLSIEPRHHSDPEVSIPCEVLPQPLNWVCFVVAVVIIIIGLVSLIIEVIGSIVDWMEDDDEARDEVNRRTCAEIRDLSNDSLVRLIRRMLDGATLDDDENAILHILNCLPSDRVQEVVEEVGRGRLMNDFDGDEWDRLMIRLEECGLATFREWDDDATRRFIGDLDCSDVDSLTLNEIRQLMLNLFEGDTGDADERAILRVVDCLTCERRRELVAMRSMSVEDFDDEVDGAEWDRLERRFSECDID